MSFAVGQDVRIVAWFTDNAGSPTDPGRVSIRVKRPDGTELSPAPTVTQDQDTSRQPIVGKYHATFTIDAPGVWRFRVDGTDPAQAAQEGQFTVPFSAFG